MRGLSSFGENCRIGNLYDIFKDGATTRPASLAPKLHAGIYRIWGPPQFKPHETRQRHTVVGRSIIVALFVAQKDRHHVVHKQQESILSDESG